ncbi:RNA-binding protein 15 isoform X2 [Lissotriton helveticus]
MKGKERSPAKAKRSRGGEDRDRGGRNKPGGGGSNGSSAKSDGGRRGGHQDKGRAGSREYESRYSSTGKGSSGNRGGSSSATPEAEYKTLRISELGSALSESAIEDGLFHEFKRFGDVSVKMSHAGDERVAFVNFRRPEDARAAKHARGRLVLYDRPLKIEAVYVPPSAPPQAAPAPPPRPRRSRTPPPEPAPPPLPRHRALSPAGLGYRDYRLQQLALGRLPPPPPLPRDLEPERDFGFYESGRVRGPAYVATTALEPRLGFREPDDMSPEDDQRANRTLFLGNLDVSVNEAELRRHFQRFGAITEVDIKRPTPGQHSTYGFLKFENLDMAHRAKIAMSGKLIMGNSIKIGYGKATPSSRLWVGGLGHWVPLAALAREFDRFGTIRTIDYRKGDSWAYIQYESLDAASAACTHMRGFPLGGPDRRLRVDFADSAEHHFQTPFLQPLPLPHYDMVGETFGHRAPEPLRPRDRSPPLLYRDRERNLYPETDWAPPPVRERNRPPYEPLDTIERRRDGWSLERDRERDLLNREQPRKRRLLDEGRHLDRSPEVERSRKRPCVTPDRSPEVSGGRDGARYNDNERPAPRVERASSASRTRRGSQERGQGDKKERKISNSVERERKHRVPERKSPLIKEERTESKVKSPQKAEPPPKLGLAWQGMLLLKNSNFPSSMHLLQGDMNVASSLLVEAPSGGKVAQLKITQRLRLDQPKLDEVSRRIKVAGPSGYAILLAVPNTSDSTSAGEQAASTQRPLRNLVSYLKQKQAAGVISLPVGGHKEKENSGVLHAFPPCDFSKQFLDSSSKTLAKCEDDYLVMVIPGKEDTGF